jgi:hypothetical protein
MSAEGIGNCDDLCTFIKVNRSRPELIAMALSSADNLAKIEYELQLISVIDALSEASHSGLIPLVLTTEILAKIDGNGVAPVILALNRASRSDLILSFLTTEILAKIADVIDLYSVIRTLNWVGRSENWVGRSDLIPLVLTDKILAKIKRAGLINYIIPELKDPSYIAIVLVSDAIRANIPGVCDPGFADRFDRRNPEVFGVVETIEASKPLVVEAFKIIDENAQNARWSPFRRAWVGAVVSGPRRTTATVVMGAGATAGDAGPAPAPAQDPEAPGGTA